MRAQLTSHQAEFEQKLATKIAQLEPGSQDGVISSAELRIKKNIEEAMDKNWQNRMEKEDKININKFETLNSMVTRLEAEVLNFKGKYSSISAASTVATSSSGSGGSHTGLLSPGAPSEWVPTRIKLKGRGVWRKIREIAITMDKAKDLVDKVKALTSIIHHEKFDWDMIAKDQGFFEIKMAVFFVVQRRCLTSRSTSRSDGYRSSLAYLAC